MVGRPTMGPDCSIVRVGASVCGGTISDAVSMYSRNFY